MPHKMDSERIGCSHSDKAFGPLPVGGHVATGQPFICRDCGLEGAHGFVTMVSVDFDKVRQKKAEGGFNVPR